jgi:hypothetical protein
MRRLLPAGRQNDDTEHKRTRAQNDSRQIKAHSFSLQGSSDHNKQSKL